ncbi:MAG: PHP domain-containing protein [Bryobacteraceae bacterium]|jgi:predicted metal-dependent phosphoesterase TrpH
MIDLHTHTDESDGTVAPGQLVRAAVELGLEALAITDHDTLAGYDRAVAPARSAGLDLVCGIELGTKLRHHPGGRGKAVHVLGYFFNGIPTTEFRVWLGGVQHSRRDRNRRLAARLESLGLPVTLAEVERLGRSLAGRPHFARLMVEKGYVCSAQEAFDLYLGESGKAYVERDEPALAEGIRRIREAGGLPSVAHPIRLARHAGAVERLIGEMRGLGLGAVEAYHSDHSPTDVGQFLELARRLGLVVTGGTDFHGGTKPAVALGTGIDGNVAVPRAVLDNLRQRAIR